MYSVLPAYKVIKVFSVEVYYNLIGGHLTMKSAPRYMNTRAVIFWQS